MSILGRGMTVTFQIRLSAKHLHACLSPKDIVKCLMSPIITYNKLYNYTNDFIANKEHESRCEDLINDEEYLDTIEYRGFMEWPDDLIGEIPTKTILGHDNLIDYPFMVTDDIYDNLEGC